MHDKSHFSAKITSYLYVLNVWLGFLPPTTNIKPAKTLKTLEQTKSLLILQKLTKYYTHMVAILTTFTFLFSLLIANNPNFGSDSATQLVLTPLSFVLMFISLLITYIHVRIKNGDAILSLLTEITNVDKKFKKRFIPGWKFSLEVIFALILTSFFVIFEEYLRDAFHFAATCRKFYIACSVIMGLQIHAFGIQFHMRFQEVNRHLINGKGNKVNVKSNQYNGFKNVNVDRGYDNVYDLYLTLVNAVNEFNRIFGWQILFLCGTFVLCILHVINLMIVVLNFHDVSEIGGHFWVMFISYLLTTLMICIPFASSCNAAAEEAKLTSLLAYTLMSQKNKNEKIGYVNESNKELELLAAVQWQGFSAAGFFDVDHTMLFTLFGSVTSYLIVLIQLKDMSL